MEIINNRALLAKMMKRDNFVQKYEFARKGETGSWSRNAEKPGDNRGTAIALVIVLGGFAALWYLQSVGVATN